jgi:expansin (peptidoglycan-binding protein)
MSSSLWFTFLILIPLIYSDTSSTTAAVSYFTTTQTGQGTYYGNGDQGGACGLWPLPAFATSLTRVALNSPQYQSGNTSQGCGMCFTLYGTGVGSGANPIKGPIYGFVNNLCPECATGSVDLGVTGDGRWNIYWTANDCPVGNTYLQYLWQGSNTYYIKVQVRNHRVPVAKLEMKGKDGVYHAGVRTSDNFWNAGSGFPFPFTFPLTVRVTSITGASVIDTIPSMGNNAAVVNGGSNVQLPSIASKKPTASILEDSTGVSSNQSTSLPVSAIIGISVSCGVLFLLVVVVIVVKRQRMYEKEEIV